MSKGAIYAFIFNIVLISFSTIGWLIFVGGFSSYNVGSGLFNETIINQTTPEERELMFVPLNSHFILAVFSLMLLIVMVVAAILSMMPKRRKASCILAVLAIPLFLLVTLVIGSGGAVLHNYSTILNTDRLNTTLLTFSLLQPEEGLEDNLPAMFAGVLVEIVSLSGALMALYSGTVLAAMSGRRQKQSSKTDSLSSNE